VTPRRSPTPDILATAGILIIVGGALFLPQRLTLGSFSIDSVAAVVALGLLLSVPLLTSLGAGGFPRVGAVIPALSFLGWTALSFIFAAVTPEAILTWGRYASYVILLVVVCQVASSARGRRVVLWAVAIASSVTAIIALRQYLYPTEEIGLLGLDPTITTRVFSTFENPNFYAEFLVLAIAAGAALAIAERGWVRYLVGLHLFTLVAVLLLTYTRGSLLALFAGLLVAALMIDVRLIVPFLMGGAVLLPAVPGALGRVLSAFSLEGTASFRLYVWEVTGLAIRERPVFGFGLGRFYDAFRETVLSHPELGVGYLYYGAHNSYFQLAAETGIVGGLLFTWLVFEIVRMGFFYNARMTLRGARVENAVLTAGLVGFGLNALTSNTFQHPRAAVFFFILAGVQAGLDAPWWEAAVVPAVRSRRARALLDGALLVRGFRRVAVGARVVWEASLTRRMLVRRPISSTTLVAGSLVARAILGPGDGSRVGSAARPH
jgi:O-antigen ligase